jgi:hypothetical protein
LRRFEQPWRKRFVHGGLVPEPRMRLYSAKIPSITSEIVSMLTSAGDIETPDPKEVEQDIASVLNQYLETDRVVTEKAKDLVQARNMPQGEFGRMKRLVADQRGFKIGDDVLDYLLDQIVEMLMHSNNVDEVYAEDVEMRRKMAPVLKRHMAVDDELDRETRAHIKHVEEGTRTWEIEYRRVMEEIKRRKGM